jgi:glutaredoxin
MDRLVRLRCSRRGALAALVAGAASAAGCAPAVPPASAAQRARVRVALYTTRWCPVCARARRWFQRRGIPFTEHDVEQDPRAAAVHRRLAPDRVVPVIDVEGRILVGFVAEEVRRAVDRAARRY